MLSPQWGEPERGSRPARTRCRSVHWRNRSRQSLSSIYGVWGCIKRGVVIPRYVDRLVIARDAVAPAPRGRACAHDRGRVDGAAQRNAILLPKPERPRGEPRYESWVGTSTRPKEKEDPGAFASAPGSSKHLRVESRFNSLWSGGEPCRRSSSSSTCNTRWS